MIKRREFYSYSLDYLLRNKSKQYAKRKAYSKHEQLNNEDASNRIAEMLQSDIPFATGRMGHFELASMRAYEFCRSNKYEIVMNNLYQCAGFFPNDVSLGDSFLSIMRESIKNMDIIACSGLLCENYFFDRYACSTAVLSKDFGLFEIAKLENCWTASLENKKVLVVSPFSDTIEKQYRKREKLYIGTNILPQFNLQTYQSLLTIGDTVDKRFASWFEALEYMKKEIIKLDFDVALLGCGAYGFPLADEIKKAGKQAIHMGGTLQLLFGIMGRRWDGSQTGQVGKIREDIAKYYNEYWTYPLEERPKDADKVEYGPYWR